MNPKNITRAEARRRAVRHVLLRMFKGAKVTDGSAVRLGITPAIGRLPRSGSFTKIPDDSMALMSSDIIVVSKRTGRVLYEGPAGDEG